MNLKHAIMGVLALCAVGQTGHTQPVSITGAGASFPAPLYQRWANNAQQATGVQLNYQSIGSGGGVNQIISRTVDFGASDAPLSDERLAQHNLVQVPVVTGAVVLAYNLPGVPPGALRLTPAVLADMYLGKIARWNHERISVVNPGVRLPNLPISVVYRGDGSGTTWIFTNYLSKISDEWKQLVGSATSVTWPVGQGARGNEGVSNMVQRTPGSIGYMEISFAQINRLSQAQLQNASGAFVSASAASSRAAVANAAWGTSLVPDLINQPGADSWPIMGATYVIVPANPTQADKARGVQNWLSWALEQGDATAERLFYVPLTPPLKQQVLQRLRERVQIP